MSFVATNTRCASLIFYTIVAQIELENPSSFVEDECTGIEKVGENRVLHRNHSPLGTSDHAHNMGRPLGSKGQV